VAAEYGWTHRQIDRALTDELLVLYVDSSVDRITGRVRAQFDSWVEAVRVGMIFAHDRRQYQRWLRQRPRTPGERSPGLTGAALERAILAIGAMHPDIVTVQA
jgi:hypothetical protein